jgi:hypothetical protein
LFFDYALHVSSFHLLLPVSTLKAYPQSSSISAGQFEGAHHNEASFRSLLTPLLIEIENKEKVYEIKILTASMSQFFMGNRQKALSRPCSCRRSVVKKYK